MKDAFRRVEDHLRTRRNGIRDLQDLREHLQTALALEQATLPPYLTALYSIRGPANAEAALAIRGVAMEEMLHMVLAGNLLVALGGEPSLTHSGFVPDYPSRLPGAAKTMTAGLHKFSPETIRAFMHIEHPGKTEMAEAEHYHSIGQFYIAIQNALRAPAINDGIKRFWNQTPPSRTLHRQVAPEEFYGTGGKAIFVLDFPSAHLAVQEIMVQGEGFVGETREIGDSDPSKFGQPWEAAHYYRYQQLLLGRTYQPGDTPGHPSGPLIPVDWNDVANVRPNSKAADYRAVRSLAVPKMEEFNRAYGQALADIEARFGGEKDAFQRAVGRMMQLRNLARDLTGIPSGFEDGTMAGPSFEPDEA